MSQQEKEQRMKAVSERAARIREYREKVMQSGVAK
jgi:hypothetical protein